LRWNHEEHEDHEIVEFVFFVTFVVEMICSPAEAREYQRLVSGGK
jgi:hypothetical protein